jgi:hypothetical protein
MKVRFCAIFLLFFIVGCQPRTTAEDPAAESGAVVPEDEEVVEVTAVPADTPIPPTDTPVPANTATTATNTAVPPTPTSQPRVEIHFFSSTERVPFTDEGFLYHMGRLRDTMIELDTIYIDIGHGANDSCVAFDSLHKNWTTHLPAYLDSPDKYYPLYAEYRSIIHQAVLTTTQIFTVCTGGGGEVSEQTDDQVVQFLSWAMPRTEAMVQETIQLQQQP